MMKTDKIRKRENEWEVFFLWYIRITDCQVEVKETFQSEHISFN